MSREAKPGTIWTAKELDALPVESIVRAENGEAILVCECDLRTTDEETFKSAAEMERYYGASLFPALVLWEPKP